MAKWRAFVAVIVALSVALPPMLGNAAFATNVAPATDQVAISPSHDCCDQDDMPTGMPMANCQAAAGCAAKCFSLYGPVDAAVSLGAAVAEMAPPLIPQIFRPQSAALPFRPPRV